MRIISFSVVGEGEADRYLEATLKEHKRLADDTIIALNGKCKKEKALIKKYGFWFYHDDREWGKNQHLIKNDILQRVGRMNPDWVLALDADEVLELSREELEGLTKDKLACYFYIVNLWNSPDRYSKGLSFWNIRFFKYAPEHGLNYLNKPLHCGLAPPFAYKYGNYVPHLLLHYGLMKSEDRAKKVERYNKYDPNAKYKDRIYYDALSSEGTGSVLNLEELRAKVREDVANMKYQKKHG